jgi:SAM-dependent methyltransferase
MGALASARREPLEVRDGILVYAPEAEVNWSDELEALHEDATRTHFLDVQTRRVIVAALAPAIPPDGTAADLGCSSGLLLAQLHAARPDVALVGVDLVSSGLERAREVVPSATLVLADATDLPLGDATVDALSAVNVLEHVPDDALALREIARVLRPGGRAAVVVPRGPGLYDYYDAALGHERRYAHGEVAARARQAGLDVVRTRTIGSLLFPAFWLTKKLNRRRGGTPADAQARVAADIVRTQRSRIGAAACALEARLPRTPPFGIRELTVLTRA